jgi:hypothetical protein
MEIDIRKDIVDEVKIIRFDDKSEEYYNASYLEKGICIRIYHDKEDKEKFLSLTSKQHAENLIKALQKAIKLDWWKE